MTPVLRGSGVLCYVETRVLTRVEATGIDGFMSFETHPQPGKAPVLTRTWFIHVRGRTTGMMGLGNGLGVRG
jgi:hypothetical protein